MSYVTRIYHLLIFKAIIIVLEFWRQLFYSYNYV